MKRLAVGIVVCVLALAAGGAFYQFSYLPSNSAKATPAAAPAAAKPQGLPVEAAAVTLDTVVDRIVAVGSLVSNESVLVRPEIAGRIARINLTEGGKVEKGRVLFELDSSLHRAEIDQAKANRDLSEKNYERATELLQRGAGTPRSRDEAVASLKVDDAALAYKQTMLDKTLIRAPFDGIVGFRKVSVGDYVSPGQDLINIENIDPIKVEFQIPEFAMPKVAEGQRVEVAVDAFPQTTFQGTVMAIDPRLEAASRSIVVRARIPNPDGRLKPGLFARVTLETARRTNAVLIPEQAVVPMATDRIVFRVVDGKAVSTKVKLGTRQNGQVEIVEGLDSRATVITAGHQKIREGMPVIVLPAAGKGTGGGA